jgi:protein-disulfide isomerase
MIHTLSLLQATQLTATMVSSAKSPLPALPDSLDDVSFVPSSFSTAHDRISGYADGYAASAGTLSGLKLTQDTLGQHAEVGSAGAKALIALEQDLECVICLSAPKQICCVPCGHVCMVREMIAKQCS